MIVEEIDNSHNHHQLFAQRPCEVFGSLTTEEFADRFMGTLKAPSEFRLTYVSHLSLLVCVAHDHNIPLLIS